MTSSFLPSMSSIATNVAGLFGTEVQGVGGLSALTGATVVQKESLLSDYGKPALQGFGFGAAVGSGFAEKYALKTQARDAELNAKQEELNSFSQQNFFQKSLVENFSSQTALLAKRGILSTGSFAYASQSAQNSSRDAETAKYSGLVRSQQYRRTATSLKTQAGSAVRKGVTNAFSFLLDS